MWFALDRTNNCIHYVHEEFQVVADLAHLSLPDKSLAICDSENEYECKQIIDVVTAYLVLGWALGEIPSGFTHDGAIAALCRIVIPQLPKVELELPHGKAFLSLQAKSVTGGTLVMRYKYMSTTPEQCESVPVAPKPVLNTDGINSLKLLVSQK